jgi:tetratricopeptide (TPR) repeat protein
VTLPKFEFSYFNPKTHQYVVYRSAAYQWNVLSGPPKPTLINSTVGERLPQSFLYVKTNLNEPMTGVLFYENQFLRFITIVATLIYLIGLVYQLRAKALIRYLGYYNYNLARARALKKIKKLAKSPTDIKNDTFYKDIIAVLQRYICEKKQVAVSDNSLLQIKELLAQSNLPVSLQHSVTTFVLTVNDIRFSPRVEPGENRDAHCLALSKLIKSIDKALRKKSKPVKAACFFLLSISLYTAPMPQVLFSQGNNLFKNGNYIQATEKFKQLEKAGVKSAALYCNLGNSYYKSGQFGNALYNYQKGLYKVPFNQELLQNRLITSNRLGVVNNDTDTLFNQLKTANLIGYMAIFLFALSSLIYLLSVIKGPKGSRRIRGIFRFCLFSGCLLFLGAACFIANKRSIKYGVITSRQCVSRVGPSPLARQAITLKEGETVVIKNEYHHWFKIEQQGQIISWLSSTNVGIVNP